MKIVVLFFCLACRAPDSGAQELSKQSLAAQTNTVSSLTKEVLEAIRNKDANSLSTLVDPTGIYEGIDTDKMSAARFKKELLQKGDSYCAIFDSSCGNRNSSQPDSSLRARLIQQPITIQVRTVQGFPNLRDVAVKSANNPNKEIFALVVRRAKGGWTLQQFEYY